MAATKLKPVDVVTVGVGLTATILAKELADAGLKVVGLERGAFRDTNPDFMLPNIHDELKYARRHELMQDLSRETLTFRNTMNETALPMRRLGSFLPGEGVGGAAVHWNGVTWRFLPWDFETRSRTIARYGKNFMAEDCTSQDWGVTYDVSVRDLGQGGQRQGRDRAGRQPVRGAALARVPQSADEDELCGVAIQEGVRLARLQGVHAPLREHDAPVYQSLRRHARSMCVLWLL